MPTVTLSGYGIKHRFFHARELREHFESLVPMMTRDGYGEVVAWTRPKFDDATEDGDVHFEIRVRRVRKFKPEGEQ